MERKKNSRECLAIVLSFIVFISANHAMAAKYKAIILNPQGNYGAQVWGAQGSQQVGMAGVKVSEWTMPENHAFLWNGDANSNVDLNPPDFRFQYSIALATNGTQQVGWGYNDRRMRRALLWNGTAASYIDLTPKDFTTSCATGINAMQQVVGYGYSEILQVGLHALLWNGSADSYVDLNPAFCESSQANGIGGSQQVGFGYVRDANRGILYHALVWNGTAASCVDLNPAGFIESRAYATNGVQQVGTAMVLPNWFDHTCAMLWSSSPENYINLTPASFDYAAAFGINDTQQVGYGIGTPTDGNDHALVWTGSAESYIDLHQFLPAGLEASHATGIDSNGNIVGLAGSKRVSYLKDITYAYTDIYAVLWKPVDPIDELLEFLDESIADGNLVPARTGPSGKGQLGAFINMIKSAGEMIKDGNIEGACGQLNAALSKTDGQNNPPDFVTGKASLQLAQMIEDLITDLGCK